MLSRMDKVHRIPYGEAQHGFLARAPLSFLRPMGLPKLPMVTPSPAPLPGVHGDGGAGFFLPVGVAMADQQRWFKLWYSALADDHLQDLSGAERWAWVALGAYTKMHGTRGRVLISPKNTALASAMDIPKHALLETIKRLPHVVVEEGQNVNGHFSVTWKNWNKYQVDSTVAQRVSSLRSKRRGEEKRKRGEETLAIANVTTLSSTLDEARDILDFLNQRAERNFQSDVNLDLIRSRLKAGATIYQIKAVISRKVRAWKGTDMEKYLRPETLFNRTKFAQYLGELPVTAFSPEGGVPHA